MVDGERYLIKIEQEHDMYVYKMAYWFNIREEVRNKLFPPYICPEGFYRTPDRITPYKNVVDYWALDNSQSAYLTWECEEPVDGKLYLVYRVGSYGDGHYTVRTYRKKRFGPGFGSSDVKYWIRLNKFIAELEESI